MTTANTITRKELSDLAGGVVRDRTIARQEKKWGLGKFRLRGFQKPILYNRKAAIEIFIKIGLISNSGGLDEKRGK